jgi:hypothetical protein
VSPVKYELGFYIPEEDILHSHRREALTAVASCLETKWRLDLEFTRALSCKMPHERRE